MVTPTGEQVAVSRADLAALLEADWIHETLKVSAPTDPDLITRLVAALAGPAIPAQGDPPWHLLAEPIGLISPFERDLCANRAAHLDQVQARLRSGLAALGVAITDPHTLHHSIALLAYVRATAVHDQRNKRLTAVEGAAVRAVCAGLAAAMVRWVPPEVRP